LLLEFQELCPALWAAPEFQDPDWAESLREAAPVLHWPEFEPELAWEELQDEELEAKEAEEAEEAENGCFEEQVSQICSLSARFRHFPED